MNYTSNGYFTPGISFDIGLGNWVKYNNGAALPTDGTSGAASITFTQNTTLPLVGLGDGKVVKTTNSIGNGISFPFTVNRGVVPYPTKISFIYETTANYVSGDIGVYVLDVTNNVLLYPSAIDLPASTIPAEYNSVLYLSNTSSSYRLILHIKTSNANPYDLKLDAVSIGEKTITSGAAISEWKSFTPVIDGAGSMSAIDFKWRRVGSNLEVSGRATSGTVTGVPARFYLPAGITARIENSLVIPNLGQWYRNAVDNPGIKRGTISYDNSGTNVFFGIDNYSNAISPFSVQNFNTLIGNEQAFSVDFRIPISQWSSNINLVEDFTEYAYNSNTAAADDAVNFAYGPEGVAYPLAASATFYKRVRFKNPVTLRDKIIVEINNPVGNIWMEPRLGMSNIDFTGFLGLNPIGGTPTDINVGFGQYAFGTTPWSVFSTYRWRVRKISNGNSAEYPDYHTHTNKANIDTINQNLSTTSNVSFGVVTASLTGNASSATAVTYSPNRTDVTAYPVLWGSGTTQTSALSCAAVTIKSSTGELTATKVFNAVWMDIVDFVQVEDDCIVDFGYAYCYNKKHCKTSKYAEKGTLGIASDTFGFGVGQKKDGNQIPIAIGGFVLAHCDKIYESGTPLTSYINGVVTKANIFTRLFNPERILGTFYKEEKETMWNSIVVNNRHWIKVK